MSSSISKINTYCQKFKLNPPYFKILKKEGQDHCPSFQTCCVFEDNVSVGQGLTLKSSKEDAATKMVEILNINSSTNDTENKITYTIVACDPPLIDIWENKFSKEYTLTLRKKDKNTSEYKNVKVKFSI
jgi:hypothetical protein